MKKSKKRSRLYDNDNKKTFLSAIASGDINLVKQLACDSYINSVTDTGLTPLHVASDNGHVDIVIFLLSQGADINKKDNNGITPLHLASYHGYLDVTEVLLDAKTDIVNCVDYNGFSPLHIGAQNGHVNLVNLLLSRGANLDQTTLEGDTALQLATYNNNVDIVKLFLNIINSSNLSITQSDWIASIESGHTEMIELFLYRNFTTSPLFMAIEKGSERSVALLLANGERLSTTTQGYAEIHAAVQNSYIGIVQLLLKYGANINQLDHDGMTPLSLSVKNNDLGMITLLLDNGADVNLTYNNGISCLHRAVKSHSEDITLLLLKNGADITLLDNRGYTPFHIAAKRGYDEIISLLLIYGANIDSQNSNGLTALHIAFMKENYDSVILLIQNGANIYDNSTNEVIFLDLLEMDNTLYSDMYSQYIGFQSFYQIDLNNKSKEFLNSANFNRESFDYSIINMKQLFTDFVNVIECCTNRLDKPNALTVIKELLHEIAKFCTISEIKKTIEDHCDIFDAKEKTIEMEGYYLKDVERDKDCFFRASAVALNQPEHTHDTLRKMVDSYISNNQEKGEENENDLLAQALSDVLNVSIRIEYLYNNTIIITPKIGEANNSIRLLYTNNDYYIAVIPQTTLIHNDNTDVLSLENSQTEVEDILTSSISDSNHIYDINL